MRHCGNVVHVRLCNHSRHRLFHCPLPKLVQTVLIPHSFEIEIRPIQKRLKERYTPCMRNACVALRISRVSG